jgi:hypothetical protein
MASKKFHGQSVVKWEPTDGGFTEHVISTSSEWILGVLLMFILISFVPDFKEIQMHQPILHDPRVASSKQKEILLLKSVIFASMFSFCV